MKTVNTKGEFKVVYNGSKTYMVVDIHGDCWMASSSEKKAVAYMDKIA